MCCVVFNVGSSVLCCFVCNVGSGLCDGLIARSVEFCSVCLCLCVCVCVCVRVCACV